MGGLFRCILNCGDAGPFYSNILFLFQVFFSRDSAGKEVDVTFPALLLRSFKKNLPIKVAREGSTGIKVSIKRITSTLNFHTRIPMFFYGHATI